MLSINVNEKNLYGDIFLLSTTLSLVPYFQSIPSVKLEIILYGVYCLLALYD